MRSCPQEAFISSLSFLLLFRCQKNKYFHFHPHSCLLQRQEQPAASERTLERPRLATLAHARRTGFFIYLFIYLALPAAAAAGLLGILAMPSPRGQPMWRGGSCRQGAREWGPAQATSRGSVPAGSPSLVLLPPGSTSLQKPLRKCRPAHKAPQAPSTPAASRTAPVPQLVLDVHGHPPADSLLGKIVKKTIALQM